MRGIAAHEAHLPVFGGKGFRAGRIAIDRLRR
jgi:hypothetical protein